MRRAVGARLIALAGIVIAAATTFVVAPVAAPTAGASGLERVAAIGRLQQSGAAEEQAFVDRINQLRTSLGLAPLAVDPELTAQARIWAQTMKDAGDIFHTKTLDAGITSDWQKLGENVGVGGTVDALFDAFVASPKHYENLVDPSYRFVGVGVVWDGSRMFTAHRFMALMPDQQTTPTTAAASTPSRAATASTPPDELASAEPPSTTTTTTTAPPPPPPVAPPASPTRVALVLSTVDALFDRDR